MDTATTEVSTYLHSLSLYQALPICFHRLLQHAEEVRALKLARADVRADARVDVLPVPCGERPGNGAHRPFADVDDDAAVLGDADEIAGQAHRSEEHTSELQSPMRISYAVFCLQKTNYIHSTK